MEFDYRISVIIPVHNSEEYIADTLASLLKQKMPEEKFEVLLVNNGSIDRSEEICRNFSKHHPTFKTFSISEQGVSFARNAGIRAAKGKYLLYLDADDALTPDVLLSVADFFDEHYEETDLVTYRIVPYKEGRRCKVHSRYRILRRTGIYDLEEGYNCYIVQTTINVCVKNRGKDNVLFNTDLTIHEDQNYNITVLNDKKTIGYVRGPEYHYVRHGDSATGTRENAYYNFERATAMWEKLLGEQAAPRYIQAFVLHDINWKNSSGNLLPYHCEEVEYHRALDKIKGLINKIDDDIILKHPTAARSFKMFLLKIKHGTEPFSLNCDEIIRVLLNEDPVYTSRSVIFSMHRVKLIRNELQFDFSIRHIALFFLEKRMRLYLVRNGERREIDYRSDDFNFFPKSDVSAPYLLGRISVDVSTDCEFYFEAEFDGGTTFRAKCNFQVNSPLKSDKSLNAYFAGNKCISYDRKTRTFRCVEYTGFSKFLRRFHLGFHNVIYYGKQNMRIPALRIFSAFKPHGNIWFYQDITGVFDNAYLQFLHDVNKNDGVKRYYILHREDASRREELFPGISQKRFIRFGSRKHKLYYFSAKKIITGYSNLSNFCPYDAYPYRWYADLTQYELVYLQHGVLHASLQKMYAHRSCQIDRVVISTAFEKQNFTSPKYGYREDELIESCMPRYDRIDPHHNKEAKRLLFAPSWRINLVGQLVIDKRKAFDDLFEQSAFYTESMKMLNHPAMQQLLEKYDLTIDVKLHPNFTCYEKFFSFDNPRIHLLQEGFRIENYAAMITDYSSIVFDAVYMNCPVLYFVPDYDQFKCGLSSAYRELDLPLENGFGPLSETGEQLIEHLKEYAENGFVPPSPYAERMENLFLHKDNNACDRLYRALTDK